MPPPWETNLLKTLWEKEKLLVQAISHFPTMFSTLSKTEITIFVTFNLLSAQAFNMIWSKILQTTIQFDKNGRELSERVENTVGKGEMARYEPFLLFPQCFQKAFSQGRQKVSLCGNGLRRKLFVSVFRKQ